MINRNVPTLNIMHSTILDIVIESISEWPDFSYYAEKLRKFHPHLIERERQGFDALPNDFNTLIHGDFWFTNVMLKHDGDKIDNIALIDFQFNCWASPAVDLQYFLNTSIAEKLQMRHQPELVQYYHKKLVAMLKRLNYQNRIPTLLEFHLQFLARSIWGKCKIIPITYLVGSCCIILVCPLGFTAACLISPIHMVEECDDADVEALLGTDQRSMNFKRLAIHNPKVQVKLRALIPKYESLGVFDCDAE